MNKIKIEIFYENIHLHSHMSNCLSSKTQSSSEQYVQQVLDELDQKGFESLQKVLIENPVGTDILAKTITNSNTTTMTDENKEAMEKIGDNLISIITDGAKEFEKKTGRPMTYAEMRYAYG